MKNKNKKKYSTQFNMIKVSQINKKINDKIIKKITPCQTRDMAS